MIRGISAVDAETVFCQAAQEGHQPGWAINTADARAQGSVSHRGLLQVSPEAAGEAGLGNGQGEGLDDEKIRSVNPDYIGNIYNVETNISIGSKYLKVLSDRNHGIRKALEAYRKGVGTPEGKAYADKIQKCADKVRGGDIIGGLRVLYPNGKAWP